jgi:hypothetical protein
LEPLELEDLESPREEDPNVFDRVTAVPGEMPTVVPEAPSGVPPPRPSERPTEAPISSVTAVADPVPARETRTSEPPPVFGAPSATGRRKRISTRPPRPPSRPTLERAGRRPSNPQGKAIELELEVVDPTPERPVQARPDALEAELPIKPPIPLGGTPPPPADAALVEMKDRYATGDFSGALVVADGILENEPAHEEALRCQERCTEVLSQMYLARLGSLRQVVQVALSAEQIRWLSLDHRAGFLLSLVDGTSSIEELLDISSMPRLEALRILYGLLDQRVIELSG